MDLSSKPLFVFALAIGALAAIPFVINFTTAQGLPWWAFPVFYIPIVAVYAIPLRMRSRE